MSAALETEQTTRVDVAFLDGLFAGRSGYVAVAYGYDGFWDGGRYKFRPESWSEVRYAWPDERDAMVRELDRELSTRRVDLYYCPALRVSDARNGFTNKSTGTNALPPNILWADCDTAPDPAVLEQLGAVVVDSGSEGHQHVYVPLAEPVPVVVHRRLNKALAALLGADAKWSDEALLRLPGSLNHKSGPPGVVKAAAGQATPWDVASLAHELGVDLSADGDAGTASVDEDITPEPAPDPLPLNVMSALRNPDVADRSVAVARVVGACRNADFTVGQALSVVLGYGPAVERARERGGNASLVADVSRMWAKFDKGGAQDLPPIGGAQDEAQDEAEDDGPDAIEREIRQRERALFVDREARRRLAARDRANRPRFADDLIDVRDLHKIPPPRMLMGELIPHAAVGFLAGKWGSYKSFLGTSWSCHLAAGTPWQGQPEFKVDEPVRVLYVASEGASGIAERIEAWEHVHGELPRGALTVYPKPVKLNDEAAVAEVTDVVSEYGFGFVVVDTYHRSAPGTDENSATEFGVVFAALAHIRDEYGTTGLFIDHTGHGGGRPRGSSAKEDDADFVLIAEIDGDDRGPNVQRTLRVRKQKDRATDREWPLRLHAVPDIGENGSAFVEIGTVGGGLPAMFDHDHKWWLDDLPAEFRAAVDGKPGARAARNIYRVLRLVGTKDGITEANLRKAVEEGPDVLPARSTWLAALKLLKAEGIVQPGRTASLIRLGEEWQDATTGA